jgi:hypothetical protein
MPSEKTDALIFFIDMNKTSSDAPDKSSSSRATLSAGAAKE